MKNLLICQVFYKDSILHSGIYDINGKVVPQFDKDFYIPQGISTGPIDCRLTIMDEDNSLISYKVFTAPASGTLISRMLNINILLLIRDNLQRKV